MSNINWNDIQLADLKESLPKVSDDVLNRFINDVIEEFKHPMLYNYGIDRKYPQELLDNNNFRAIAVNAEYYDSGYADAMQSGYIEDLKQAGNYDLAAEAEKDLAIMDQMPEFYKEVVRQCIDDFKSINPAFKDVEIPFNTGEGTQERGNIASKSESFEVSVFTHEDGGYDFVAGSFDNRQDAEAFARLLDNDGVYGVSLNVIDGDTNEEHSLSVSVSLEDAQKNDSAVKQFAKFKEGLDPTPQPADLEASVQTNPVIGLITNQPGYNMPDSYRLYLKEPGIDNMKLTHSSPSETTSLDNFIDQCKSMYPDAVITIDQSALTKEQSKGLLAQDNSQVSEPRRYAQDGQRLWNGKTAADFSENDVAHFLSSMKGQSLKPAGIGSQNNNSLFSKVADIKAKISGAEAAKGAETLAKGMSQPAIGAAKAISGITKTISDSLEH